MHLATMLNWDEKGRGPGYEGWNGEALAYHRKHNKNRPLNPDLVYPVLPAWIAGDIEEAPEFEIRRHSRQPDTAEFKRLR